MRNPNMVYASQLCSHIARMLYAQCVLVCAMQKQLSHIFYLNFNCVQIFVFLLILQFISSFLCIRLNWLELESGINAIQSELHAANSKHRSRFCGVASQSGFCVKSNRAFFLVPFFVFDLERLVVIALFSFYFAATY